MRVSILKDLQLRIVQILCRSASTFRADRAQDDDNSSIQKTDGQTVMENIGEHRVKLDSFENRYTPRRLILLVALSILLCGLLIRYLFIFFPRLHSTDIPLIGSVMLITLLSPALYAFFYTPMVRQFDKLRRAEVKMRELAHKDILTGLYNRRGFLSFADQLLKLSDRAQRGLILIYADLDNLKLINDDCGHEEGTGR